MNNEWFPVDGCYCNWSKRERLAAMAMQGLCASSGIWGYGLKETARYAFDIADAMLAYQDKENDNGNS